MELAVYCLMDSSRECVKFGYSKDVETVGRRIKALQTASPFPLEVVGVDMNLGPREERQIHQELRQFATGGGREWYDSRCSAVQLVIQKFSGKAGFYGPPRDLDVQFLDDLSECPITALTLQECECMGAETSGEWCDHRPEETSTALAYLHSRSGHEWTWAGTADLVELFLAGFGGTTLSKKVAQCVSQILRSSFPTAECFKEIYPVVCKHKGLVMVLFVEPPNLGQDDVAELVAYAECLYKNLFWTVDAYGCQLFVSVLKKDRTFWEAPYELHSIRYS